jgi:glycosyltransferase involved in cell wall biosynthesis
MAVIAMADDGLRFDGRTLERGPLGGAETAFVSLAEALARRGHRVLARNNCEARLTHAGVEWAPLVEGMPEAADLYIANRGDRLLPLVPAARRRLFWIHNPARYLMKWRYLTKLWRYRPVIVFSGNYHARTYPRWAPSGARVIVPYGISDAFRHVPGDGSVEPPPPRAVFTSNPLRSLDWLLDLWARRIQPAMPEAELHVFSGPQTYGGIKAAEMSSVLERARALVGQGVVLRVPVSKDVLAEELRAARVLLYRGDVNETFCLAVGEAQAAGLPCVVRDIGCVRERVIDGETGIVARSDDAFVAGALRLLSDHRLWYAHHLAASKRQRGWGWDDAAQAFEALLP